MRDPDGRPSTRMRLLALLVALGLLGLSVPLLAPMVQWLLAALW